MEEAIKSLRESSERHTKEIGDIKNSLKELGEIKELIAAMGAKYDQLAGHIYGKQPQEQPEGSNQLGFRQQGFNDYQIPPLNRFDSQINPSVFSPRYARIDFPQFGGEDPNGWIYKCKRFFDYNGINMQDRVKIASLHLEDSSLQWFEKCH